MTVILKMQLYQVVETRILMCDMIDHGMPEKSKKRDITALPIIILVQGTSAKYLIVFTLFEPGINCYI